MLTVPNEVKVLLKICKTQMMLTLIFITHTVLSEGHLVCTPLSSSILEFLQKDKAPKKHTQGQ